MQDLKAISKHLKLHPQDKVFLTDNVYVENTYNHGIEARVESAGSDLSVKMKDSGIYGRKFNDHKEFDLMSGAKIGDLASIIELFAALEKITPQATPKDVKLDELGAVDLTDIPF